ncbi:MAG: PilN domain-containing protein [Sedimentisphaerales bacterium]|nr:PilN domain-containing protein [Sedimentisphaerales bacterium]
MRGCVGIDITGRSVRIVQISRKHERLFVPRTYTKRAGPQEPAAENAPAGSLLAEALREAGIEANVPVVVGLPYDKVFFSSFRTDLAKQEDVRRLLKFELEDDFPVPFDDLVIDICGDRTVNERESEYLIAAVSRREMDACLHELRETGRKCAVLSTDVCALQAVVQVACPYESGPLMILHADGHRMILGAVQDNGVVYARHVACAEPGAATLAREVELARRAVFSRQGVEPIGIFLSGSEESVAELSEPLASATGCEIRRADLWPQVESSQAPELGGQYDVALGYALIGLGLGNEAPNFLGADVSQADRTAKSKAKHAAAVSVVLLAAILALFGAKLFGDLRTLKAEDTRLEDEIRTVFTDAFPDEKKIVNELAQMTEHLKSLRKERDTLAAAVGQRVRPLRILHVLSERMTAEKGIGISSFSIKDATVQLAGTGRSFESVEQFLQELRQVPEFASVELEDVALSQGSDRPAFRLLISVRIG